MPALTVLVKVEILAPFDQIVDLVFKLIVIQLLELVIIKRVIIERFKLFLEAS